MAKNEEAPEGKFVGQLNRSHACFRIFGDDLVPEEITRLLGCPPSEARIKGEVIHYKSSAERTLKTGSWRLVAPVCEPENLDQQVEWLLSKMTDDLEIWRTLNEKFDVDLFCGLFMETGNDGLFVSSKTLLSLGLRGIDIDFDIYDPSDD